MFDIWYDGHGNNGSSLGQEYLINDSGDVSLAHGATSAAVCTENLIQR